MAQATTVTDNSATAPASAPHRLRILATSDLHMHLLPWSYGQDRPAPGRGLLALQRQIAALRSENLATLLLDNGDFLQGSMVGAWHAAQHLQGGRQAHPMISALSALGYDAVGLGNHEFDFGLDYLADALRDAPFACLSANLRAPKGRALSDLPVAPWTVVSRSIPTADPTWAPLKIGIFSVLPSQTLLWNRRSLAGHAEIEAMPEAAKTAVAELRAAGADLVVGLCHTGIEHPAHPRSDENAALILAKLPGIDAIVTGHTHRLFPGPDHDGLPGTDCAGGTLHGIPAVMPGRAGSHLGRIDLQLAYHADQGWQVTGHDVALHSAEDAGSEAMPAMPTNVATAHRAARRWGAETIGETKTPLHSYFDPIRSGAASLLMATAQAWAVRNALIDAQLRALPLLSAVPPFQFGGRAGPRAFVDIAPGPITRAAATTLFPFPNVLRALVLTGAQIRDWLDHAASTLTQIRPGRPHQPLLGPGWASHNFDILHGLRYRINLAAPPRPNGQPGPSRIEELRHDGRPVRDADHFVLATNDYRANGGGGFPGTGSGAGHLGTEITAQDALAAYLASEGPFEANCAPPVFSFEPCDGAEAILATGRGARAHIHRQNDLPLRQIASAADGFDRYCLSLV